MRPTWTMSTMGGAEVSRRISPHAMRAPALPVTFEHLPLTGGLVTGSELSPRPRSSSSPCTITERPITVNAPSSRTSMSDIEPSELPDSSATMLPRSPAWRSSPSGAPCVLPCGFLPDHQKRRATSANIRLLETTTAGINPAAYLPVRAGGEAAVGEVGELVDVEAVLARRHAADLPRDDARRVRGRLRGTPVVVVVVPRCRGGEWTRRVLDRVGSYSSLLSELSEWVAEKRHLFVERGSLPRSHAPVIHPRKNGRGSPLACENVTTPVHGVAPSAPPWHGLPAGDTEHVAWTDVDGGRLREGRDCDRNAPL